MDSSSVVAVFGGSFSPVHTGHMEVARSVVSRGLADEVILMPCRRNPLKDGSTLLPDNERISLLRDAVKYYDKLDLSGHSHIWVSDMELGMPSPSYTRDTLRALRRSFPQCRFRLLVGADSYLDFNRWKDWKWIEHNFSPVVYPRPGYEVPDVRKGWELLEGVKLTDISSTRLREMMAQGESVTDYMPWIQEKN